MQVLTISGSSREKSTNTLLLKSLANWYPSATFDHFEQLQSLPLFDPNIQTSDDENLKLWRDKISTSDAIIICTPEYLHNLPALIKNALEWTAQSGEFDGKPVLPITYTPFLPRGEKTMQSLTWSLTALNANIVGSLTLDKKMVQVTENLHIEGDALVIEAMKEAMVLLGLKP